MIQHLLPPVFLFFMLLLVLRKRHFYKGHDHSYSAHALLISVSYCGSSTGSCCTVFSKARSCIWTKDHSKHLILSVGETWCQYSYCWMNRKHFYQWKYVIWTYAFVVLPDRHVYIKYCWWWCLLNSKAGSLDCTSELITVVVLTWNDNQN